MLALRAEQARDVSICKTTATTAEGVAELAETIEVRLAAQSQRRTQTPQRTRRVLVAAAGNLLNRTLRERDDPWLMAICDKLQRGELDLESAAQQVLCSGRISDG